MSCRQAHFGSARVSPVNIVGTATDLCMRALPSNGLCKEKGRGADCHLLAGSSIPSLLESSRIVFHPTVMPIFESDFRVFER
jgi:hypothetical protein